MIDFETIATGAGRAVGHPFASLVAIGGTAAGMALIGIDATNIAVSIVSLVLLCLLQHSQNWDGAAIQVKLDELIKATADARDELIGIDRKTEVEIEELRS